MKLDNKLRRFGLLPTNADSCIYKAKKNGSIMIVMTYVDDMLIASDNEAWMKSLKMELMKDFKIRDLGLASYCLGIQIQQKEEEIKLTQESYINEVLVQFGMSEAKPVTTPMDPGTLLIKKSKDGDNIRTNQPYRELIGSLMYIAIGTRPDIAHSVSVLSQFNDCFDNTHWSAAKKVLRYLKGTSDIGLIFKRSLLGQLEGYVDANWGSCLIDRRSYTGYVFLLSNSAISWESHKQRTVALSTTEAEYMGITEAVKESIYLKNFLIELGFEELSQITLWSDNQGASLLTRNDIYHQRSKHIDIRYHFVREALKNNQLQLEYKDTNEMAADILTKGLQRAKHNKCIELIGMI